MSNEVELKLAVTSDAFDILKTQPQSIQYFRAKYDLSRKYLFRLSRSFFGETKNGITCPFEKIMISHLP